ncbi:MAG TPA: diacylglycerol kinase family protein [Verrucomicrobiae bacterium]|nr:diacylglycerol kinase family protein [Verrucomicrobiae bacterium]
MRALLIVNPEAGHRTAKDGDLERAIGVLKDAGVTIERVETGAEGPTAEDLARRAVAERYEACVVAGGDGTVQPTARALAGTEVVLGILPFGTHMNVAHGLGVPLEPIAAAHVIARGRVHRADGGVVHERLFFEIAGVGLDAELFGTARNAERGRWRKALGRMWRYATHGTHRVTIIVDGATHAHRVMQILVLNSPYYGWSLPLLPDASMEDGLLDVAVFPRMGRLALIGVVVALARGAELPQRPVHYRGARIAMTSAAQLTVHADGKVVGPLPAEFVCQPGVLKVFV